MTTSRRLSHKLLFAACLFACAAPLTQSAAQAASWGWGWGEQVKGNGVLQRQQRQPGSFNGVASSLAAAIEIRIGNSESISIETDENLLPLIETVVEDGMLKIRTVKRNMNLQTRTLKIVVQAKSLDHLSLGGSGSIDSDALRARKLQIDLGGSGKIHLKGVEADSLAVSLGGSGDLLAAGGTAARVSISIGGSGNVDLGKVRSDSVDVSIAGSGETTVWAQQALNLSVAGSGTAKYYGDPRVTTSVIGSGSTRRLGTSPL